MINNSESEIDKILKSMQSKYQIRDKIENERHLENTKETWQRIGNKDSFDELGFDNDAEKESFLKEFIENNPYKDI
jgi:hypothetical protein